ncbi:Rrf2 family transcriptional regulator, group III [Labilithrix luteola]|uniref:Rrf2 family transcriptional regulator, group III n=2 Tax=Labilithrix luteola TaxID=1391654 RepID=A0A0K1QEU9_9BACT|nr:Rrf2 family transcriptional regulator, group III [Labilithrix luteola]
MSDRGEVMTSEALAEMLEANPVVLRRTLAKLRGAGIVRAEKGHGGGWALTRELSAVTLADVYQALGTAGPFSFGHRDEKPRCLIEQAVNRAVGTALAEAEARLVSHLGNVSLADVATDVRRQAKRRPRAQESA